MKIKVNLSESMPLPPPGMCSYSFVEQLLFFSFFCRYITTIIAFDSPLIVSRALKTLHTLKIHMFLKK